jgi:hypothetical protein
MTIPIKLYDTGRFVYLQLSTRPVKPGVMCFAYGSLLGGAGISLPRQRLNPRIHRQKSLKDR